MTEVVRIDHEVESRTWLLGRFREMAQDIVTTWDIAQDIAANWTEGRRVSELPECEGKYPGQVFGEWLEGLSPVTTSIDRPDKSYLAKMLKAARIKQLAPPQYQNLRWSVYSVIPAFSDADQVADIFAKAAKQPIGVSRRGLQLVMGNATGMKPPYWNQVISNLMTGEHLLTPAMARNIIATAQKWLQDNPDAPTRR
jgi:hypothetical protein